MKILIIRLRWWLWSLLADHGPEALWGLAKKISPSDKELDMLDALDRGEK